MPRHADHPIAPQFLGRWSPRALRPEVTEAELLSCLEAARWAPSTSNTQPWRYVVALAGEPSFATMLAGLVPFNLKTAVARRRTSFPPTLART